MLKNVMDVKVNYYFLDSGSDITIVLLHGWGQNVDMMKPIGDKLKSNYNILNIDLPGFGKSSEPKFVWSMNEYVKCINKIVNDLNLHKIVLVGHSFGGRISLLYSSIYDVYKLVCLASPFCKELNKLPFKTKVYKFLKKVPGLRWVSNIMKKHIGSTDYKNASEVMRGVLVKSINLEMINDIKKIKCPTLLIWGKLDTAVPINRAYELNKLINTSKLIVYEECTHYAYLEKLNDVVKSIDYFIRE